MELKALGTSSVKVTPIAFGAWAIGGWMWGGAEGQAAIKAIKTSLDAGITTIDTAPIYGFGKSEELVGQALQGIPRDRYQILTKYGMNWRSNKGEYFFDSIDNSGKPTKIYKYAGRDSVLQECEDSLRRLKTDYIDLLQIHWPDATTPIGETMEAVAKLIEQGKVRAAGVCNYSVAQVEEALKTVKLASNQVPYSMIHRAIEKDVVPQAIANKMSIIPYSPLQRGLLTGKIKRDHKFNAGDTREGNRFYKPENIDRTNAFLQKIKPVADGYGVSLAQLVINWTTRQPAMDCVLVGARDDKQVQENVKSLSFKLSDDEIKTIRIHAEELMLVD
ncbi:aldo/keto reductase [Chryseolinea sp. H1M3-3]|uniref:aldo/keto reductase n=1 Tax=Chryseolinea sp. H1M3-3 TaxID=3034144 RepID=UPI0023EC0718|nr:aldo/keto reductase [Chryseolinea sp. H1M3-3]